MQAQKQTFIVGTYTHNSPSQGIYVFELDTRNGAASPVSEINSSDPSFLTISTDKKFVYSVNESDTGSISAFAFNKKKGGLRPLNSAGSQGAAPCYISLDRSNKWLFSGNYSSGSLSVHAINADGSIGSLQQVIQHEGSGPDKSRQESPHVHCTYISQDNRFLYVPDLGLDRVMIYPFDAGTGRLDTTHSFYAAIAPGKGPRHITFSDNGLFAYLIEEMGGGVDVFKVAQGRLTFLQREQNLQEKGPAAGADIHLSPDGRFLYTSQRSNSTIQIYGVETATGRIRYLDAVASGGNFPRNFAIDPTGQFLLAAHQKSDDIHIFRIDKKSGMLTPTGKSIQVGSPVCIRFVNAP